jgi:hypothetical protein
MQEAPKRHVAKGSVSATLTQALCLDPRILVVAVLLTVYASPVRAQWDISEDAALGSARVTYKRFRDAWTVTFDDTPIAYSLLVPQLCQSSACNVGQIHFPHLSCDAVSALLLDPAWFNENAASDIATSDQCPASFVAPMEAQVLLGSVMPEPFVYVSVPASLTIHNNATLLDRFDQGAVVGEWTIAVRLLFLTALDIGSSRVWSVRRYVAHVQLAQPELSFATLAVQSACAAVGLVAPRDAQLEMRTGSDGSPVCAWLCRIDAMRTPWNAPPSVLGGGSCRPLRKYFTAIEFAFTVDTSLPGVVASRLAPLFFDELDMFAARVEMALDPTSLLALTVPHSDFDTTAWRAWVHEYIVFAHRSDTVFQGNGSLILDALREIGHYTEAPNPDFTYAWRRQGAARRYSAHDIVVKGLWFSADVTTNLRTLAARVQATVARVPHTFSPVVQVNAIAQVDVAWAHRVALSYTNESVVELRMQRDGVTALEYMCLLALVMAAGFHRCRHGPHVSP